MKLFEIFSTSPQMTSMQQTCQVDQLKAELSQAQVDGHPEQVEALKAELAALGLEEAYKPYTGGAGPEAAQSKNNDNALARKMKALGYQVRRVPLTKIIPEIEDFENTKVVVVGRRYASYDRWGFCGGIIGKGETLDQEDLETTVKFLSKGKRL